MHDAVGVRVSSYYVEPAAVLVDPKLPEQGLDAFSGLAKPQQVGLTSGHHIRDAGAFADAVGCVMRAPRAGRRAELLGLSPYFFALQIGAPGFEPGTSPTRTVRATRLRHAPMGGLSHDDPATAR